MENMGESIAGRLQREPSRQELLDLRQAARVKYDGMFKSIASACRRHIAIVAAERARVDEHYADMIQKLESAR